MPLSFNDNVMSEIVLNSIEEVSVIDVYDLASDIGAECEKLIDLYGSHSVKSLIPKCITALEMLEALASKNERETSIIQDLTDRITKLEDEKAERAETKRKFEKEIETVEEAWRCETRELVSVVTRLQADNIRLSQEQKEKSSTSEDVFADTKCFEDGIIQKLKEQVDKQRNEIKEKNKSLQEKVENIEQFSNEIEQIKHQSNETKKRSKILQSQVKTLCEERADFLGKIQDQHREMVAMKKQLGILESEEDLEKDESTTPRFTIAELKEVLAERNDLKNRINDLEEELMACKPTTLSSNIQEEKHFHKEREDIEEEAPVQGPLPEEWYMMDDVRRRKTSDTGIRKFFRKLFADDEDNSSFPKRSLSTLTKMALSASGPHTDIPI